MDNRRFPDPRPGYKTSTRSKTEGVAKTGQVSKKGTVTHTEHWSGQVDAAVKPRTVAVKLTTMEE